MKKNYDAPLIEVIEFEIEGAVLGMSIEGFDGDGVNLSDVVA